jgi:uncharacterized membrane protein
MDSSDPEPSLDPVSDLAQASNELRASHQRETSPLQSAMDRITALVGWPGFLPCLSLVIIGWLAANGTASRLHLWTLDPPPFAGLQAVIGAAALFAALLVLTTQRREAQLLAHSLQLTIELTVLIEQKTSKIIQLQEEARRDNPILRNRPDEQAAAMSTPSDPQNVLEAIKVVQPPE